MWHFGFWHGSIGLDVCVGVCVGVCVCVCVRACVNVTVDVWAAQGTYIHVYKHVDVYMCVCLCVEVFMQYASKGESSSSTYHQLVGQPWVWTKFEFEFCLTAYQPLWVI